MVRPVSPFGSMVDLPRCAPRGLYDRAMASMAAAARVNDADGDLADAYAAQGFVSPLRIVAPAVAAEALEEVNAFARSQPDGRIRGDLRFKPHLFLPRVGALVREETVLRAVRAVLKTRDVLLWSSDLNIKERGDGGFFSPHQDATYTGLEPATRGCTLWLALSDPVDARHGCLRFAPGSHVAGQLPHVEAPSPSNLLSRGQRVEAWDASTEVVAALRGGGADPPAPHQSIWAAHGHNSYLVMAKKKSSKKKARAPTPDDIGATVFIEGLQSQPELNGSRGTIIAFNREKNRYTVECGATTKKISVKPENLRVAGQVVERSILNDGDGAPVAAAAEGKIDPRTLSPWAMPSARVNTFQNTNDHPLTKAWIDAMPVSSKMAMMQVACGVPGRSVEALPAASQWCYTVSHLFMNFITHGHREFIVTTKDPGPSTEVVGVQLVGDGSAGFARRRLARRCMPSGSGSEATTP
ncbi:phytanoyl-CoA dioxygenase [Aureococcus anophagefferens]|nr:phytanoyl-CoA dioxygenase [Aureococcus anophagefferens]